MWAAIDFINQLKILVIGEIFTANGINYCHYFCTSGSRGALRRRTSTKWKIYRTCRTCRNTVHPPSESVLFMCYFLCIVCCCNPANRAFLFGKSFSTSVVVRVSSIWHRWFNLFTSREKADVNNSKEQLDVDSIPFKFPSLVLQIWSFISAFKIDR